MIITNDEFNNTFNTQIFGNSKKDLIEKIAESPDRYVGIFRPTKPRTKIIQNILQSHEIRFGDALENIIELYLARVGYEIFDKRLISSDGDDLSVDQLFSKDGKVFFVEQKVRDDHDSTKKRGQVSNFEKKLDTLCRKYGESKMSGFFYFIDDSLKKNENYYKEEIDKISSSYSVDCSLCYGKEFFDLIKHQEIWEELLGNLKQWRRNLPDLPETNFDINYSESFEEIKDISPSVYRKLFENAQIRGDIFPIIFPTKKVLRLLIGYFKSKNRPVYDTLAALCSEKCL